MKIYDGEGVPSPTRVPIVQADVAGLDIPAHCDNLKAWRARVTARPGIAV